MTRARAVTPLIVLILGACGGPSTPLEVGVREIDTDVLIGPRSATPGPSAPPSFGLPPGFPGFVQPPITLPPVPSPSPSPDPTPCPPAPPISPILHPVTSGVDEPPVAGAYRFRNDGSYTLDGARSAFPRTTTRTIDDVARDDEGFAFDVTSVDAKASPTTTRYHVVPGSTQSPAVEPGVYIERVTSTTDDGEPFHFVPTPSLMVLELPASIGQTWTARGIDPLTGILMQFAGKITARRVVDACGTRLEAWDVEITDGVIRSPSDDLTFRARLAVATQYGGISIADSLTMQGTDDGRALTSANVARISQEPALP